MRLAWSLIAVVGSVFAAECICRGDELGTRISVMLLFCGVLGWLAKASGAVLGLFLGGLIGAGMHAGVTSQPFEAVNFRITATILLAIAGATLGAIVTPFHQAPAQRRVKPGDNSQDRDIDIKVRYSEPDD